MCPLQRKHQQMQERSLGGRLASFSFVPVTLGGEQVSSEVRAGRKLGPRELMDIGPGYTPAGPRCSGAAWRSRAHLASLCHDFGDNHTAVHSVRLGGGRNVAQEEEQGRGGCKARTEKVQALVQGTAHPPAENPEDSAAAQVPPPYIPPCNAEKTSAHSHSKQGTIWT